MHSDDREIISGVDAISARRRSQSRDLPVIAVQQPLTVSPLIPDRAAPRIRCAAAKTSPERGVERVGRQVVFAFEILSRHRRVPILGGSKRHSPRRQILTAPRSRSGGLPAIVDRPIARAEPAVGSGNCVVSTTSCGRRVAPPLRSAAPRGRRRSRRTRTHQNGPHVRSRSADQHEPTCIKAPTPLRHDSHEKEHELQHQNRDDRQLQQMPA